MKKKIFILLLILFSFLIFTACSKDIVTYADSGTIKISFTNSGIDLDDVKVYVSDENASIDTDGNNIIISKDNMLRTMVTLSCKGFQSQTVLIKSTDFNDQCVCEMEVTLNEAYTLLQIDVNTTASSKYINVEGNDIISKYRDGKTLIVKLKAESTPELTVSAGSLYDSCIFTLTQDDIKSGICMKTILLKSKENALIQFDLDTDIEVMCNSNSNIYYQPIKNGRTTLYEIQKSDIVRFRYYRSVLNQQSQYVGEAIVTADDMLSKDNFYFNLQNSLCNISYTVYSYQSYSTSYWHVLAEKTGENSYAPINYCSNSFNNYTFSVDKTYTVFTMNPDGRIRYKDLDLTTAEYNNYTMQMTVTFEGTESIRETTLRLTDILGINTDFAGLSFASDNYMNNSLGTISSGNQMVYNAIINYSQIASVDTGGDIYKSVNDYSYIDRENVLKKLATEGIYDLYMYKPFDLRVNIISNTQYEGAVFTKTSVYPAVNYTIDNQNSVLIEDFSPNTTYIFTINNQDLNDYIKDLSNIKKDELGNYYVDITID